MRTNISVYILLTIHSHAVQYQICILAFPFDLRCESATYDMCISIDLLKLWPQASWNMLWYFPDIAMCFLL